MTVKDTTIRVTSSVKADLLKLRKHPEESMNTVIQRLITESADV